MGTHQWRFQSTASQTLNLEQFAAEEAARPCASNEQKNQKTHRQGRPCAPSDLREQLVIEKATAPVKAAPPNMTISHSDGRKILATYSESGEI